MGGVTIVNSAIHGAARRFRLLSTGLVAALCLPGHAGSQPPGDSPAAALVRTAITRPLPAGAGVAFSFRFKFSSDQSGVMAQCASFEGDFDPTLPLGARVRTRNPVNAGCGEVIKGGMEALTAFDRLDLKLIGSLPEPYVEGPMTVVRDGGDVVVVTAPQIKNPNFPGWTAIGAREPAKSTLAINAATQPNSSYEYTYSRGLNDLTTAILRTSATKLNGMAKANYKQETVTYVQLPGCCRFPVRNVEDNSITALGMTLKGQIVLETFNPRVVTGQTFAVRTAAQAARPDNLVQSTARQDREIARLRKRIATLEPRSTEGDLKAARELLKLYPNLMSELWQKMSLSGFSDIGAPGTQEPPEVMEVRQLARTAQKHIPADARAFSPEMEQLALMAPLIFAAAGGDRVLARELALQSLDIADAADLEAAHKPDFKAFRAGVGQRAEAALIWSARSTAEVDAAVQRVSERRARRAAWRFDPRERDRQLAAAQPTLARLDALGTEIAVAAKKGKVDPKLGLEATATRLRLASIFAAPGPRRPVAATLTAAKLDALVVVTTAGSIGSVAVLTPAGSAVVTPLPGVGVTAARKMLFGEGDETALITAVGGLEAYLRRAPGGNAQGWQGVLSERSTARQRTLIQDRLPQLETDLWSALGATMVAGLDAAGIKPGARVAVMESGVLSMFPLGAARNPATGQRLLDRYELVRVQSLDQLSPAVARSTAPARRMAGLFNPSGDLRYAALEGDFMARPGGPALTRVAGNLASGELLSRLDGADIWHFATHASYDWAEPSRSGLRTGLAADARLNVEDLLRGPNKSAVRLVVLSACETGLVDLSQDPDDYLGLPSAFLRRGAGGVVATLWPVDDLATALLIGRFYDLMLREKRAPSAALRSAQTWLRDSTAEDLTRFVKRPGVKGAPPPPADILERLSGFQATARPYASSYFWGGFIFVGA